MIPNEIVEKFSDYSCISIKSSSKLYKRLEVFFDSAIAGGVLQPELDVDEAWHFFLMNTFLYREYCLDRYGSFLHHKILDDSPLGNENAKCMVYIEN